jgi:uncharacterized protein
VSASGIYEGWMTHRRRRPVEHSFRYRVFMPLLDLDELPEVLDPHPLWSARRAAPAWLRRADYLRQAPVGSLSGAARDVVCAHIGRRPEGPIRLLAHPRYLGVGFNPVSFLFCHRHSGELDAVIAEVTNTPWGERQTYVLDAAAASRGDRARGRIPKLMHVSPFMGMDQVYEWWVASPSDTLDLGFRTLEHGEPVFDAALRLRRRELSRRLMLGLLLTYPPMTIATLARIYLQALGLRIKGVPVHPHPRPAQ